MRILGVILLLAGLAAAFGTQYLDIELPASEVQPIGFVLIAVGVVMVALGGRRRRRNSRAQAGEARPSKTSSIGYRQPEPEPQPQKREPDITWGRDGDQD